MNKKMLFPEQIKAMRMETGLSQVKFAELIGMPRITLQSWEYGKSTPSEYLQAAVLALVKEKANSATRK